jgi:glutamate 5-kinase
LSTDRTRTDGEIRTIVVKIGTSLLAGPRGFNARVMEARVKELARLKQERNLNILLVSSGAIGCGMLALGLAERPRLLPLKQATAAVGQSRLMHEYELLFARYGKGLKVAQVLLSSTDFDNRRTYLNVRNTIKVLFEFGCVVPIVNENDSVATEELQFGDNDTLAARVAAGIDADLLIILSDVDGLYDKDPARHKDARLIEHVPSLTKDIEALAADTQSETGIGGMKTKLLAARITQSAGLPMVIANGHRANIICRVLDGKGPATTFGAGRGSLSHRKRWIAFGRAVRGVVQVDAGASHVLLHKGKSLLAAGITGVQGEFDVGAAVRVVDPQGQQIACGLVNYASEEIARIMGRRSKEIEAILGRKDFDEVIHRDNLVILQPVGCG